MGTPKEFGLCIRRSKPEIGVLSYKNKIVFSTFSFKKSLVKERLNLEIKKQGGVNNKSFNKVAKKLLDDALGKKDVFDWSILSEAQYKVLRALFKTKKLTTYGELAKVCNTGPRAVGKIMNSNPFSYFVPCHRVLSKTGIGGFANDLSEKTKLLALENHKLSI